MADVYVATDDTLDRRVAIKVLNERFAGDPEIRTRFTREARIAARLSIEPNVVTIFDVADVAGQPAIVMEFLPGGTLADRMRAGRIPPALGLAWLEQAGRALDAAHAAGVIHRDVKPANLMLGADGEVRVTDFGIARIAGDVVADERRHDPRHLRLHVARAGRRRHGDRRKRPLRPRRRRVRAALRPQAVPGRDLRRRGRGARDGADPGGDGVSTARCRRRSTRCSGARSRRTRRSATDRAASSSPISRRRSPTAPERRCGWSQPRRRRRPPPSPPPRSRHASRRSRRVRRDRCRPRCAGASRHRPRGGRRPRRRCPAADHRRQDGDRGRRAAGAHRHRRGAARRRLRPRAPAAVAGHRPGGDGGSALNDQGFRLLKAGDAAAALPILERAVAALQGSGSLTEAYALYNLALARFSTGDCNGVTSCSTDPRRSRASRSRDQASSMHDVDKGCKDR